MKARRIWTTVICLLLAFLVGCGIYVSDYYRADTTALAALQSTEAVTVSQTESGLLFSPAEPTAGFIFYPGGKVEHSAYAPLMLALAQQDILCVLVEMPFRLAVLDMNAAEGIPEQFPQIEQWYIGGHSLGGSMAASHAANHNDIYDGLVLLAAYATEDLTDSGMAVLSVYGEADTVLSLEKYGQYRENLPEGTIEQILPGGNHAFFGNYGPQDGDGTASISPQEQQDAVVSLLTPLLKET